MCIYIYIHTILWYVDSLASGGLFTFTGWSSLGKKENEQPHTNKGVG